MAPKPPSAKVRQPPPSPTEWATTQQEPTPLGESERPTRVAPYNVIEAKPPVPVASPARPGATPSKKTAAKIATREVHASPAGLFRRTLSWVVDVAFISAVVAGLMFVAIALILPSGTLAISKLTLIEKVALPTGVLAALISFVYSAMFAFFWQGRTLGRRLAGIHLVDNSGHAPGPVRAFIRALLSVFSFGFFLAGFWLALFDRKGQTLHDKLSNTFVVRLRPSAP